MRINLRRFALALLGVAFLIPAGAQTPIPADEAVRKGQLPNGLTYYIRHNETPKGQADFYIAQKVGSILEEDNQRGLAHFLEHMCFNGTQNFPGNSLISWLEGVGVKFGQNLNAYTGIDQTVYMIQNVPTDRTGVQDTCLLILHDWADGLLLDPEEIDKERGVIHEEWRTTNVGQQRILERLLPEIYPNNKYGYRLPIGTMEVVDNFPYQALRDYYETWYRPDQQGVIVVGDIDVDRVEAKIKELFSPIKMPNNPKERVYTPVEDTKGTIYAIGTDKEQPMVVVQLMFKSDATPDEMKNTVEGYVADYVEDVVQMMLYNRLQEISMQPDAPFAIAQAVMGDFLVSRTKDAFTLVGVPKGDDVAGTLQAIYREGLRACGGGFTMGEYERASKEWLSHKEKAYNDRENTQNSTYVQTYVNNFLENKPMPSWDTEYQIAQMLPMMVSVDMINQAMSQAITRDNRVVLVLMPDKEGMTVPTDFDLAQAMAAVEGETIEPYVDEVKEEPLIPVLPAKGSIISENHDNTWGTTVMNLSNGATVIVKPTTFKNDEVLLSAIAKGNGAATISDDKAATVVMFPYAVSQAGLGDYTFSDLQKYMQGHQVQLGMALESYSRKIEGATTPRDLPMMMELLYMTMTDVTMTPDEFQAFQNQYGSVLHNQEANPQFQFQAKRQEELFQSPKRAFFSAQAVADTKREDVLEIAKNATKNAADWTFVIVGNVDVDSLRPLVEQYIASLPGDAATSVNTFQNVPEMEITPGTYTKESSMAMETPQVWVVIASEAKIPSTTKSKYMMNVLAHALTKRLLETVREDEGAVYSIGAYGVLNLANVNNGIIQIPFPMQPEKKDKVLKMIDHEIASMAKKVKDSEVNDAKEFLIKEYREGLELNGTWTEAIVDNVFTGTDMFNGAEAVINSITPADIQALANEFINQGNRQTILLVPAK
ncbi:MAG: insulinase family protein [Bacteroidales bacterium]|nr:insulinase family protein [Bacteroidales bacterium]MCD8395466.1 insulinase family protein [Bacteroidales bacterium]